MDPTDSDCIPRRNELTGCMLADVGKSVWSLTTAVQNSFPESFHSVYGEVGRGEGQAGRQGKNVSSPPCLGTALLL